MEENVTGNFDESIITKAQQIIGEIESFENNLTVIKQDLSDISKCNRYFVNEKKRMRKRQYDNNWENEKRRKVSKLHVNLCKSETYAKIFLIDLVENSFVENMTMNGSFPDN